MELLVNSVYLSREPLDVESGQRVIKERAAIGLIEDAPSTHLLGFGWERPHEQVERPWASDLELVELLENGSLEGLDGSAEVLGTLEEHHPEMVVRYLDYVRQSAERWLANLAWLASGQDRWFETHLANRINVEPRGTLLLVPERFSAHQAISTTYGEIIEAAELAFPAVASASGAHPLDRCRLRVDVLDS